MWRASVENANESYHTTSDKRAHTYIHKVPYICGDTHFMHLLHFCLLMGPLAIDVPRYARLVCLPVAGVSGQWSYRIHHLHATLVR